LRIGSNSQLKGFFQRQHIEHTKPDLLYQLRPSAFYRQQIAVELFRRLSAPLPRGQILTDSDILKLQQLLSINGNMKPSPGTGDGEFMVKLENLESNLRPLGLTLTETHGGRALVHRVTADGLAQSSGIRPGDYVVGVGSDREWRYQVG
jgi:S1-C subfamily serine protease